MSRKTFFLILTSSLVVLFSSLSADAATSTEFQQQAEKNRQEFQQLADKNKADFERQRAQSQQDFEQKRAQSQQVFEQKKAQSQNDFQQKVDKNKRDFEDMRTKGISLFLLLFLAGIAAKLVSRWMKKGPKGEDEYSQKEAILAAGKCSGIVKL